MSAKHPPAWPALFIALILWAPQSPAQDEPPPNSEEDVVERILELKREIDDLLARLPPETRDEVRRKLAEPPSAPPEPPLPEASAAPPPPEPPPAVVTTEPEEPASPPPPPRRPRFRRTRPSCNTLEAFDTSGDGTVDARDRYWRYLYLWLDKNGNGQVEEREAVSTYRQKVREISADLEAFASAKAGRGEIRIAEHILLDLRGNGFGSDDDAVLVVDATALKRGTGPTLLDASGAEIEGLRPFERGFRLRDSEGHVTRLTCP